jgi:hypothetical protein
VGKIDYQNSAKHSLFGRLFIATDVVPDPSSFNTNLLQDTGRRSSIAHAYTFGSTYLVNSNTVQAFRLSVNRTSVHFYNVGQGELFTWCDAGVKIYCAPEITRIQRLSISGAFGLNSGFLNGHKYVVTTYTLNDDVSLVRGAHQIALGVSALHGRDNSYSNWASATAISFNGSVTGLGLADFLLGRVSSINLARSNPHHVNGTNLAFYATDTWKATSKVTLNYGMRWEPYLPHDAEAIYNFDYERFRQGIKSSVYLNAPAGIYYRGDPGFPENGVNTRWFQFAPRVGLAWDVSGDGKTSVRASYAFG